MQASSSIIALVGLLAIGGSLAASSQDQTNPLAKVLDLVDELSAKIVKEGEVEQKAYDEYLQWCQNAVQETGFAIETATKEKGELEAKLVEVAAEIETSTSKIEELAAAIATNEADLSSATSIREKEAAEFAKNEKEMMEVLSALDRAISILEKEFAKNPASFAQVYSSNVKNILHSLSLVADAAAFSAADKQRLLVLAQTDQADESTGAPAAAVCQLQSGDRKSVV